MAISRTQREHKRQLGQYMTPDVLAQSLVDELVFESTDKVLEPSFGEGAFLLALIGKFMDLHDGSQPQRLAKTLQDNIYGVELDPLMYSHCLAQIEKEFGPLPDTHNLVLGDFFLQEFDTSFDFVVGNPPFGGSINPEYQDELDKRYGKRHGLKIKKETYSFFTVKCLELLKEDGRLRFICSDTFLTISTMKGLRALMMMQGHVRLHLLSEFSQETDYPMVVIDLTKGEAEDGIEVDGQVITKEAMELTGNLSWQISSQWLPYFQGQSLGNYIVCTSGMTIGKNELFVREILSDEQGQYLFEPYEFSFYEDPVTLENYRSKARLGKVSKRKEMELLEAENEGRTKRNIAVIPLPSALRVDLPHPDYTPYNKAVKGSVYHPPTHMVYWKDEGDAVYTYKKNGNWYLHGVGGKPYFGREGITWSLVSSRLQVRYLPAGYIFDSGAPVGFLREGVAHDELLFIQAWLLTKTATAILKSVINHTRNIQSKDVERLPYPSWVDSDKKSFIIKHMQTLLQESLDGKTFDYISDELRLLDGLFTLQS